MIQKLKQNRNLRSSCMTYGMVIAAYVVMQAMLNGGLLTSSLKGMLVPICAYVVMAVSLNLTVGVMGELSLGHAGFMSVGAFSAVIAAASLETAIPSNALRLVVSMAVGGVFAGLASLVVVIPVLRLRGDYLAIVTLAFGEIIKNILNCVYVGMDTTGLHFSMKDAASMGMAADGKMLLQGPMGAVGIQKLSTLTAGFLLVLVTLAVVLNFMYSRSGRAVMALRDNRIAAESVGVSPLRYKMMAFVTSAVLAGFAGGLYAMNFSSVVAKKFDFNTSILVLVFVVLGGMGNIRGSIIAATALTVLPELLRQFADYRMLVYAIVLILVMLATNNPKFKAAFHRLKLGKSREKEAV